MNKKSIIFGIIGIFIGVFLYNALTSTKKEEIKNAPNWVSLKYAQDKAIETGKLVLVDVWETGCKFCKAMEREVYPDSTVRHVLDANYIPVKVNGNSDEFLTFRGKTMTSREFAGKFGVYAYPTTLILDTSGNLLKKKTGFMGVDDFRRFLYTEPKNL